MFSSWPAPESMIFEVSFRTRSDHGWRPVGSRIRRTTRTRPGGAAGGSCAKRPHSRSPGHDPPNPASPSTTGPSAERAREQQQGAYAVGFSLGGGLALCQHADRTIIYLYGLTLRHQHASADNPCGVVYPHAPASVMSGRGRPSPGCVRVLGMGVWAGHPKTHTLSYRTRARRTRISVIAYSGDRAGFMAGSFGDRARLPMEAAWTPGELRPGAAGPPPR